MSACLDFLRLWQLLSSDGRVLLASNASAEALQLQAPNQRRHAMWRIFPAGEPVLFLKNKQWPKVTNTGTDVWCTNHLQEIAETCCDIVQEKRHPMPTTFKATTRHSWLIPLLEMQPRVRISLQLNLQGWNESPVFPCFWVIARFPGS